MVGFDKDRNIIERIGYDVSVEEIKERAKQMFVFDTHAIEEMLKNEMKILKLFCCLCITKINLCDSKRVKRPS